MKEAITVLAIIFLFSISAQAQMGSGMMGEGQQMPMMKNMMGQGMMMDMMKMQQKKERTFKF